jgi:hypothetical protein
MATLAPTWVWDPTENTLPCYCCSPTLAMEDGRWTCRRAPTPTGSESWVLLDEAPDLTQPHDLHVCDGTCKDPLHASYILKLAQSDLTGETWGDLAQTWDEELKAHMTAAEKARLIAEERKAAEEAARLQPLIELRSHMMRVSQQRAVKARCKGNVGLKKDCPCKELYSPMKSAKNDNTPTTLHVSSECWAHEFTDPLSEEFVDAKTGRMKPFADGFRINVLKAEGKVDVRQVTMSDGTKVFKVIHLVHVCWNQHPDEKNWKDEWKANRLYTGRGVDANVWRRA